MEADNIYYTVKATFIPINSLWYKSWEGFVGLTCILSAIFVTFQMAFRAQLEGLTSLVYLFDAIYIVYIALRFYAPYMKDGRWIICKNKIKKRYLKCELIIDVLSVLPIELISLGAQGGSVLHNWQFLIRIERINRVLRIYNMFQFLGKEEVRLGENSRIMRCFKYALLAFSLIHFMACGWYMLACPNASNALGSFKCYKRQWAVGLGTNMDYISIFQRYIKCFYWATITATSTGYGDISAVTMSEKWFTILTMLCGVSFFFGPILGYMASTITNLDSKRARYTHRMSVINDHLVNKSVTEYTQKRVAGYYEHLWNRHQGVLKKRIFHELPLTFQAEISLVLNKHVIEKAPLFKDVSKECMRMVSLAIKPVMYIPKQIILNKNDIRHTMFYISKGAVNLYTGESSIPVKTLKEGCFFGEAALLLNIPRAATIRAASYCELLILERSELTKVLSHFANVAPQLYDVINKRCADAVTYQSKDSINSTEKHVVDVTENETETEKILLEKRSNSISIGTNGGYIIHQEGKLMVAWEIFMSVILIGLTFLHSYVAAFQTAFSNHGYSSWFGCLYVIDLLFIIDIIFTSRTVVKDENETPVENPKEILRMYVKTKRFWMDLFSVIPIELFCFVISDHRSRWLAVTFTRTNRLIKLYKVFQMLKKWEADIGKSISSVRIIKLSILIAGMCHTGACIWFLQACMGYGDKCAPNSWAMYQNYNIMTPKFEMYITSLYWAAATMTSTGYGDISAHTTREEFIATIVFVIGLLLFGYCLSNIAAILTNKLHPKVDFMGRINGVVSFIKEQNLSNDIVHRVEQYLALVWRMNRGEAIPGCQLLMGDMPHRLQQDVSFEEMEGIISMVTLFQKTDEYFMKLLSSKLITYLLMPGDMIVYRGDVGREMYIIRRGLVEVLSQDRSKVVATLGPGSFFGEVGLIFGESRTADVRTKTYCEVAMLRNSDLDEVLETFPLVKQQFKATSQNEAILERIKTAVINAPSRGRKSLKRIELIEQTKNRRSRSVFKWNNKIGVLDEEQIDVDKQFKEEFEEPYKKLHKVLYFLSHLLLRKTIDPCGTFIHVWTVISVVLSCLYYITIGLQFSFYRDDTSILIFNYCLDTFFLVDIYIKLHVGYFNKDGILITHPTKTASNYIKSSFLIDFAAFLPLDLIATAIGEKEWFYYMKLNRALHILRVQQYFSYLEEPITSASMFIQSTKFSIYTYLIIHVFAAAWFKIACPSMKVDVIGNATLAGEKYCIPNSWAQQSVDMSKMTTFSQYVTSLYWASATACGVGYGDIHAHLVPEKMLSVFCMIFGVVFFGYIIASVTASLANADALRARYQSKLDTVNRFLADQKVESALSKRIKQYYKFLWTRNKGVNLETLFEGLPNSLQADITLSLYKEIIESVPLFQGTELGFTKMLSLYISPLLLPKGEYIVRKGDIGEEMFFIHKGIVEVVSEHATPIVFDTMSPGRFFGEISTIFSCPRTASVRAQTNADLFVLKKKDLDVVLGHYPHIRKQIMETAEERQRMVQERARIAAEKKAEEDRKKAALVIAAMRRFSVAAAEKASCEGLNETGTIVPVNLLASQPDEDDDSEYEMIVLTSPTFGQRLESVKSSIIEWLSFTIPLSSHIHLLRHLNCYFTILSFMTFTYMFSFNHFLSSLFAFNILMDISFYIEIFLKFHMSYLNHSGDAVTDAKEIAKSYFNGEFAYDVVANLPIWLFCFTTSDWRYYYSVLGLLQILRLKRFNDFYKRWLEMLDINVLLIRLSENALHIVTVVHMSACIWYKIACFSETCLKNSWVSKIVSINNQHSHSTQKPFERYTDSLYWALATMTSTGYGDISATRTNLVEMIFASMVMALGKILFGFVLGNVASTMANMESLRVAFEERFSAILSHMLDQNMPFDIKSRVINFYQYIWCRNKGSTTDGVFEGLPMCLNSELYLHLIGDIMKTVPMFEGCELPFIRLLCTKTNLIQFHEMEYIYRKGDIGNEMYFITEGEVEIESTEGKTEIYAKSEFFGDESLFRHYPRISSARAVTHVDMFSLHDADLTAAFISFPEEAVRIEKNLEELDFQKTHENTGDAPEEPAQDSSE